nr:alpha/beta hydrolase [Maritimibacter dapengensis]
MPPYALQREARLQGGVSGIWVSARPATRPVPSDRLIFYVHGGGFIAGAPETHAALLARLAWLTGVEVFAPRYRLAPEHPFPAGIEDIRAAWEALLQRGYSPDRIVLAGDSAGGNIALALLAELCSRGQRPAGLFALSPHTDFTFQSPSIRENEHRDTMLPANRRKDVARWYLSSGDVSDCAASPIFATFLNPPPVLLQYSQTEILRDDASRLAAILRDAGGNVEEQVWPDAPHVFQIFDGWVPEARDALEGVADFVARRLDVTRPGKSRT